MFRHGQLLNNRAIRQYRLSGPQMGYLRYIFENPGIRQEELSCYHKIDKGAVAKSIRRMVELGYIRREQNPQDRRAYQLFVTERGTEICEEGQAMARKTEQMLAEGLTEEEIQIFLKTLEKVTDNMEKILEGGIDEI